jgi:hypothetical protein
MQTLNGRPLVLFAFCILHFALLLSLTGCGSKARAQTLPDGPPLAVPVAPVHEIVIEKIAEAPPQEPEPAPEPAPPKPADTTIRTQTRPQAPRTETAPAANQPAVTPPPAPEAPVVRAAPAASVGDEKKALSLIAKAKSDLENVNYQRLSAEGKNQYNQSKQFSDEAQQAIKERNFLLANTLAEKAAKLAAELVR